MLQRHSSTTIYNGQEGKSWGEIIASVITGQQLILRRSATSQFHSLQAIIASIDYYTYFSSIPTRIENYDHDMLVCHCINGNNVSDYSKEFFSLYLYRGSRDPLFNLSIRAWSPDNAFSSIGSTPPCIVFSVPTCSDAWGIWLGGGSPWFKLSFALVKCLPPDSVLPAAAANCMLFILSLIASNVPLVTAVHMQLLQVNILYFKLKNRYKKQIELCYHTSCHKSIISLVT